MTDLTAGSEAWSASCNCRNCDSGFDLSADASAFAYGRIAESLFWIPAAVGTLVSRKHPKENSRNRALGWADIVLFLVAALVVRLMVGGISFAP
ncbi:MAG TPA: hypothetical protein VIG25_05350 [Pyrinomonadaceae bacterium]|jgi:hypothetical protein